MSKSALPTFADVEIRIHPQVSAGYPVELTVDRMQQTLGHASAQALPRLESDADLADMGEKLFAWLFSDELVRRAWERARGRNQNRRIRLQIAPDAAELTLLPWELMREPDALHDDMLLSADPATPFARYRAGEWDPGEPLSELPIKLLIVIANPPGLDVFGLDPIDVDQQKEALFHAIASIPNSILDVTVIDEYASLSRIAVKLSKGVDLLHVVAHGLFRHDSGRSALFLADMDGDCCPVYADEFQNMLARQLRTPRFVFLAACNSAVGAESSALGGLATDLMQTGVASVLAMHGQIPVATATEFCATFYHYLLGHGQVDLAANQARAAIFNAGLTGAGIPVLFSRLVDNRLIELPVEPGQATGTVIVPPPKPEQPIPVPRFVGREQELRQYRTQLEQSGMAAVVGMMGTGKSALATELALQIAPKEKIFWYSFRSGQGLETLIWKMAEFLFWNGQPDLLAMLQGVERGGGRPPPSAILFDHILEMIRGRGYLLYLDDFHLVNDDPLLNHVATRMTPLLGAGEVTLLIASQRLPEFMQGMIVHPLDGLTLAEAHALMHAHHVQLPDASLRELHRVTEGNAEFLVLALDAVAHAPHPRELIHHLADTDDVRAYLLDELDRKLTDIERDVQCTVSILGIPSTRDAIEITMEADNLRQILHDLAARYLLTVQQRGWRRAFGQHTVLRSFYHQYLNVRKRRSLHRRAAAYFLDDADDPLQAAHHLLCADDAQASAHVLVNHVASLLGRYQAAETADLLGNFVQETLTPALWIRVKLAQAEVAAFLGENRSAESQFVAALELLETTDGADGASLLRATAARGLGRLMYDSRPEDALVWFVRSQAELAEGDPAATDAMRARTYIDMAWAFRRLHQFDDAEAALEQGIALLGQNAIHARAEALSTLAAIKMVQRNWLQARVHCEEAAQLYARVNASWGKLNALIQLGNLQLLEQDWRGAVANLDQARELSLRLGNKLLRTVAEANLGYAYLHVGDWEHAMSHLSAAVILTQAAGLQLHELNVRRSLAQVHIRQARWPEASDEVAQAEAIVAGLGTPEARGYIPYLLCAKVDILLGTGKPEDANATARQAVELAAGQTAPIALSTCQVALAKTLIYAGAADEAVAVLDAAESLLPAQERYARAVVYAVAAKAYADLDAADQAEAYVHKADALFLELGVQFDRAELEQSLES